MSEIANYIIFHPERELVKVSATVLDNNNKLIPNWEGDIFVDKTYCGNEDPYVFNNPWLYSYCHASQLRRNKNNGAFLQSDSKLIFISGPDSHKDILTVDTIFVVESVLEWGKKYSPLHSQELPIKYLHLKNNCKSELWERHLKFPFKGHHINVPYSYEARLRNERLSNINYSYLPLNEDQKNVSIHFDDLPQSIVEKLRKKRRGKYPVLLGSEINKVLDMISSKTFIKVLRDIKLITSDNKKTLDKCGGC